MQDVVHLCVRSHVPASALVTQDHHRLQQGVGPEFLENLSVGSVGIRVTVNVTLLRPLLTRHSSLFLFWGVCDGKASRTRGFASENAAGGTVDALSGGSFVTDNTHFSLPSATVEGFNPDDSLAYPVAQSPTGPDLQELSVSGRTENEDCSLVKRLARSMTTTERTTPHGIKRHMTTLAPTRDTQQPRVYLSATTLSYHPNLVKDFVALRVPQGLQHLFRSRHLPAVRPSNTTHTQGRGVGQGTAVVAATQRGADVVVVVVSGSEGGKTAATHGVMLLEDREVFQQKKRKNRQHYRMIPSASILKTAKPGNTAVPSCAAFRLTHVLGKDGEMQVAVSDVIR